MYTIKLSGTTLLLTLCTVLFAQVPLEWNGQEVTIIEDTWYPDGEGGEKQFWQKRVIQHDKEGKPIKGEFTHRDEGVQKVTLEYNEQGHVTRRVHNFNDTLEMDYSWKYKYDDQGRLTERTNFSGKTQLLSQLVMIYDEDGKLTDHAGYFTKDLPYECWSFMDDEQGARIQDPHYLRYGSRHIYYNWHERLFAEKLGAFSILPAEEVFQRFKFLYNAEDKLDSTKLFDKSRNLVEKGAYFYDGRGRVRSIITHNYVDSVSLVWDLHYNKLGRHRTRLVNVADPGDQTEIYKAEWLDASGQPTEVKEDLKEHRSKKVNAIHDYYVYKDGVLVIREKRDLFDDILERWTYDNKGRLQQWKKFGEAAKLEVLRTYQYKEFVD